MKTCKLISILILTVLLTACEKVLDVDIKEQDAVLVIEGWLTSKRETHTVRLYYTRPVTKDASAVMLSNALITLKDNVGNSEILKEAKNGVYEIKTMRGREGRTYTLHIAFGGNTYQASSTLPRLSMMPDTLEF